MKKNWIVLPLALLLVFGLVFSGCETYVFPTDPSTYTEVQLGSLNFLGGSPNNQKGWIIAGNDFDDFENGEVIGPATLDIEDLQSAEFLVVELKGAISGGIDLIWGAKGNGWNQTNIVSSGKAVEGKATFDDGVLTIDLAESLDDYGAFLAATEDLRILIQYWTPDFAALGFVKGYLLIPAPSDEFVPVTDITGFPTSAAIVDYSFALSASYSPKSTAMKNDTPIIWSISPASPLKEAVYDTDGVTLLSGSFDFDRDTATLVPLEAGTIIFTATILGGSAVNAPFIRDFQVTAIEFIFPDNLIAVLDSSMPQSNGVTQVGWSGIQDELKAARYLVLELTNLPEGEMQVIANGDGGWKEAVLTTDAGDGTFIEKLVTVKASQIAGAYTVTIDLVAAFASIDIDLSTHLSNWVQFYIGYYDDEVADLGIVLAYLLSADD